MRTTRGAQKRKEKESTQTLKNLNENAEAQLNHYLVPPTTTKLLDSVLNQKQLSDIESYVKARAQVLAQEKFAEMEDLVNEIIHQQMKKVRAQHAFVKEFEQIYDLQESELAMMKEECLAERIAISKVKATGASGSSVDKTAAMADKRSKVFQDNEFAVTHCPQIFAQDK